MRIFVSAIAIFALFSALSSSAPAAPSFGCRRTANDAERAICNSSGLSTTDTQLAQFYRRLIALFPEPAADALRRNQRQWIERRNRCGGNFDCLLQSYRERMVQLKNMMANIRQIGERIPHGLPAFCPRQLAFARELAQTVSVDIDVPSKIAPKQKITVHWRGNPGRLPGIPVFLVVDAPPDVKFSSSPAPAAKDKPLKVSLSTGKFDGFLP